ncbi:putative protein phosphatase 2C 23 [Camellia lanceoleosa]|uniref:Uncharacterized protein n=1 Tax=Camellia lanceoleosa TaxID=1840588 RepID=A0ACC0I4G8_9ERIC|nr:putative protein phosphatase 2C 23 [Camellia lanceoleosa]
MSSGLLPSNSWEIPSSGLMEMGFMSGFVRTSRSWNFLGASRKGAISKTISRGQNLIVMPIKGVVYVKEQDWIVGCEKQNELTINSVNLSTDGSLDDDDSMGSQNLQWAQRKAGEDTVHVIISEEHGWVFVEIYDGFNSLDAPDYLLSNLYSVVHKELKGLLWDDKFESSNLNSSVPSENSNSENGGMSFALNREN